MSSDGVESGGSRKRTLLMAAGVILAGAVAFAVAEVRSIGQSADASKEPVFEVAQGPLTISVTESGTVQPRDQITIKSEVEGTATILYLVDEGTHVKEGDLLVQLDASTLEDTKVDREISVQNAEASYISARENLEVVRNQAQSDIDEAELALRFAREDLKNYKEGEYPNEEKELAASITLAEEELQKAEDELRWSRILSDEKYLSESELKADELAVSKAKLDVELAQSKLALLQNFTYKRTLDERESDVKQAEMALERTKLQASANIVQAEATTRAAESEFTRVKAKLEKTEAQIQKAKIVAPADGLVVYATSAQVSHPGRDVEPLDEGQQVRESQELIYLPTGSTFKAEVSIHEASLEKVHAGLPVRITVDAIPGQVFSGTVASIAPLPDARSMFMNPDLKVYATIVHIGDGSEVLRSGMTCKAEIIVEQHASASYVPIQSVVRVKGQATAFVKTAAGIEPRQVEIGLDNNRMVHIVSGLEPGEMVLLNPPLEAAALVEEPQEEVQATVPEAPGGGEPASAAPAEPRPQVGGAAPGTAPQTPPSGFGPPGAAEGPMPGGFPDLTEEQREEMRKRFESMSPEERDAMRRQGPPVRQGAGGGRPGQDR